jgi:protein TonB
VPLKNLSRRPSPKNGPVSPPPYPPEAKKEGVEGPVVLKVFIDKKGHVRKTQVVQSPHTLLAKAAQVAMGNVTWTSPLDKHGNPVDTVIVWRFRFVLDG